MTVRNGRGRGGEGEGEGGGIHIFTYGNSACYQVPANHDFQQLSGAEVNIENISGQNSPSVPRSRNL